MKKLTYRSTMLACYNGYITQAIAINLAPLLYLIFQSELGLTLGEISLLIAVNFTTQLALDVLASLFSKHLNLRLVVVLAHVAAAAGLCSLSLLPMLMPPFLGLLVAEILLGVGGGLTEVIISPLIEACPTGGKSGSMSLLHSFYCWGQAGVVLFSSLFFAFFEAKTHWIYLPYFWALIPLMGAVAFCFVPIYRLPEEDRATAKKHPLWKRPIFWLFLVMMCCGGASEMVMSQWASSFAESALGVDKALGDLFGPCMFALMMGLARALYGAFSKKVSLEPLLIGSCVLCIVSYLLAACSPSPVFSLIGCALCGISVGLFWPGTLSRAAERIPTGGISMFALLAVAGDTGCLMAPSVTGKVAEAAGGDLRIAFLVAIVFPLTLLLLLLVGRKKSKKNA